MKAALRAPPASGFLRFGLPCPRRPGYPVASHIKALNLAIPEHSVTRKEPTLETARIHRNYVTYFVLATNWPFLVFIITIPILLVSVPLSYWLFSRRYERLRVTLHPKTMKIRQGVLMVSEKTIPLNKITDLAISHGPIMRAMGLKALRVETAGQSGAGGALAMVVGIIDTDGFRDTVLDQRDKVVEQLQGGDEDAGTRPAMAHDTGDATLMEIRDTLMRIEKALAPAAAVEKNPVKRSSR